MRRLVKPWIRAAVLLLVGMTSNSLFAQLAHWRALMGDWYFQRQSYEKAMESYEKAGLPYNMGHTAYLLGDFEMAAVEWVAAAASFRNPSDQADAWYNAGNAYYQQGRYAEAVDAYKNSLRRSPNREDARKNLRLAQLALPPATPPSPPPPPPQRTTNQWLDQANWRVEVLPAQISAEEARKRLEHLVVPLETESAKQYRRLAPSNIPRRGEKAW